MLNLDACHRSRSLVWTSELDTKPVDGINHSSCNEGVYLVEPWQCHDSDTLIRWFRTFSFHRCSLGGSPCLASSIQGDLAEQVYGDWQTGLEGLTAAFEPDGTWSVTGVDKVEPFDTGTFTFDGSTLVVETDDSSQTCNGHTGTYEVTFVDASTASLDVIEDGCRKRRIDWQQGLTLIEE